MKQGKLRFIVRMKIQQTHSREKQFSILALILLLLAIAFDIWEDVQEGEALAELLKDVVVVAMVSLLLAYIYVLQPMKTKSDNKELSRSNDAQAIDIAHLSHQRQIQLEGLATYIDAQFDAWSLTAAEKDVALMLLKGFSMKEISNLRQVSERTTRQQAVTIYCKADIGGRAELSAFFLEDLLLPSTLFSNNE